MRARILALQHRHLLPEGQVLQYKVRARPGEGSDDPDHEDHDGAMNSGYRCGVNTLNGDNGWERLIYHVPID